MHSGKDKLNLKTFDQLLLVTNQLKHHTTFWVGSFDLRDDFFFFCYIIVNFTISFANYSITHSHT